MACILILEPSSEVRELLVRFVRRLGHEALTGLEAEGEVPAADVIVLEPAWEEGLTAAHKAHVRDPALPILCVSTEYPTPSSKALGPVRHLVKPFSLADFESAVRAAVGSASRL